MKPQSVAEFDEHCTLLQLYHKHVLKCDQHQVECLSVECLSVEFIDINSFEKIKKIETHVFKKSCKLTIFVVCIYYTDI